MLDTTRSQMSFDRLKGIRGERKIETAGCLADTDAIIDIAESFFRTYSQAELSDDEIKEARTHMKVSVSGIAFGPSELEGYLKYCTNYPEPEERDEDDDYYDDELYYHRDVFKNNFGGDLVAGMFAGVLLERLNELGHSRFYANGHYKFFNYLFAYAENVGELIVDNYQGVNICESLKSAEQVIIMNCDAEDLGHCIGKGGHVKSLILLQNEGGQIGNSIADSGEIGVAVVMHNKGDYMLTSAADGGDIGMLLAECNEGNQAGFSMAQGGDLKLVYFSGQEDCWTMFEEAFFGGGGVNYTLLDYYPWEEGYDYSNINPIVCGPEDDLDEEWDAEKNGYQYGDSVYDHVYDRYRIGEVTRAVGAMKGCKDTDKLFELAAKVREVYDAVKGDL